MRHFVKQDQNGSSAMGSAGSLILNNLININRSYAHINERMNSSGLVALQLMTCNKQCKMLSNFLPSNDTLPRRAEN